jgi:hypothetical protein
VLANPIDPAQQTNLPFGTRSFWLQPWRAYMDTQPASMMRGAVGINFNNVPGQYAGPVAQLLAQSGFTRARLEIGWSEMSFSNPTQLQDPTSVDARLSALGNAGLRPLILLNANDQGPGPAQTWSAQITQPSAMGSRSVQVDAATAQQLVPGLSGFNVPGGIAAAFIVTSVSPSGQAQLSQPLPVSIPAGTYQAVTLRYAPFSAPFTGGGPNPAFEQTLAGWLQYVKAVTTEARKVLGSDNFDVEIWNELSFGSAFLDITKYYNPVPASLQGTGSVTDQLLARTVQWLRDPANGVSNVGIGDGFANQTPFATGANVPAGLTAIDKHPYHAGVKQFPADATLPVYTQSGIRPVDALGQPDGANALGTWRDSFTPSFRAFFPEYYLSGIQTEFMERDLSPITTTFGGVAHGRNAAPQVWITETNIDPTGAGPLTAADKRHLQAKAALRTLSAFVNKGVSALDFYAVTNGDFAMVDPSAPGGGETMTAIKRFTQGFSGPNAIGTPRSLSLLQIADQGNSTQFAGGGSAAHPPLYNRDVVAFLPFQADSAKFVVPVYVMTRDMATLYNPAAPSTDVTRYDMPPQTYRLTVSALNVARLSASAIDPITGGSVPVQTFPTSSSTAVIQMPLTDSPRLLVLQDG